MRQSMNNIRKRVWGGDQGRTVQTVQNLKMQTITQNKICV